MTTTLKSPRASGTINPCAPPRTPGTTPLEIQTVSLSPGTEGAAYSRQLVASGGAPPYTWTATPHPPGLTLSTTGLLSGVPTTAGSYSLLVTVDDSLSATDSRTFQLTIHPTAPTKPTIASVSPTSALVGDPVTITGSNFEATQGSSTVSFGGVTAIATSWSDTLIAVTVPAGAVTGNILVTVGGQTSNGVMFTVIQPEIPSYDTFYGPFHSWINVKNPPAALQPFVPAAMGDGITDDTAALQAALDFVGRPIGYAPTADFPSGWDWTTDPGWRQSIPGQFKSPTNILGEPGPFAGVVYLPAGTYLISGTLKLFNRIGVTIVGEDPATTIIKWVGASWTPVSYTQNSDIWADNNLGYDMFWADGGLHSGNIRRLTWDGDNKARIILTISGSAVGSIALHGGNNTAMEFLDVYLRNAAFGIMTGGTSEGNDDTSNVKRCQFINITVWGLTMTHYNTLTWQVFDCIFEDIAGFGIYNWAGSYSCYNSLFLNCFQDIYQLAAMPAGVRGNVSITTDGAGSSSQGWHTFLSTYLAVLPQSYMVQGNLVIAPTHPLVFYMSGGPASFVDNAFWDQSGTVRFGLLISEYKIRSVFQPTEPGTGTERWPEMWQSYYFSGNIFNGEPISGADNNTQDVTLGGNPYKLIDQTVPAGYIPPNNLNITQGEIAQILSATAASPVIQTIKGRMPKAPERTDPYNAAAVQLTEVTPTSGSLDDAVAAVNPTKINLIHVAIGDYPIYAPYAFAGNLGLTIIGDGQLSRFLEWYSTAPAFIIGTGGPVQFRMEDLNFQDMADQPTLSTVTDGIVAIRSSDMAGGRVYCDWMTFIANNDAAATSGFIMRGFDHVKARLDMFNGTRIESVGTGNLISSAGDAMITAHSYWTTGTEDRRDVSTYMVRNGGSLVVMDMYGENQGYLIDLRGGNGYLMVDNQIKQHSLGASAAQATNWITSFTGTAIIANMYIERNIFSVGLPPVGSETVIYGIYVYAPSTDASDFTPQTMGWYDAFRSTGLPIGWFQDPNISVAGLFGLTSGEALNPARLSIGGVSYSNSFLPGQTGVRLYNRGLDIPESQPPGSFVMPPAAVDALRYRPFPAPHAINDPALTDIILHRIFVTSYRPFSITVDKV